MMDHYCLHNKRHGYFYSVVFFLTIFLFSCIEVFCQHNRIFIIQNKDTVDFSVCPIEVYFNTPSGFVRISHEDSIVVPPSINYDSINSIEIILKNDTFSFFNTNVFQGNNHLPPKVAKALSPDFRKIILRKTDMFFTIDTYPFDTKDHKETAKRNEIILKAKSRKLFVLELKYQIEEIQVFKLRTSNSLLLQHKRRLTDHRFLGINFDDVFSGKQFSVFCLMAIDEYAHRLVLVVDGFLRSKIGSGAGKRELV